MAPKWLSNETTKSSKTIKPKQRCSQRVLDMMNNHGKNKSMILTQKKQSKQSQPVHANEENELDIIEQGQLLIFLLLRICMNHIVDASQENKAMSIDSIDADSDDQEASTGDAFINTLNASVHVKPSSKAPLNIIDDDDDTEEFEALFMSNRTSKSSINYSSTPLVESRQDKP
jgi:hypothetical protein